MVHDLTNRLSVDAEHLGNLPMAETPGCSHGPDVIDFRLGELGASVLLSGLVRAGERIRTKNVNSVKMLFASRDPLEILKPVVGLDPVLVVALQANGGWANEGKKDEFVDPVATLDTIGSGQDDLSVSRVLCGSDGFPDVRMLAREYDADVSEAGNFVPSFVTNHWEPTLFGHLSLRQTDRMKAAATRYGSERSGATLAATRSLT